MKIFEIRLIFLSFLYLTNEPSKMRRVMLLLLAGMFVVGCFSLYMMLELQMPIPRRAGGQLNAVPSSVELSPLRQNELNSIEAKIKHIEEDLRRNHKTISEIKSALGNIVNGDAKSLDKLRHLFNALGDAQNDDQPRGKPNVASDSVNLATRFVMPSDKRSKELQGSSVRFANGSKSCPNSPTQSKVRMRIIQ